MLVIWDQSCNSVCYQVLRVYAIYFGAKVNGRRSDSVRKWCDFGAILSAGCTDKTDMVNFAVD